MSQTQRTYRYYDFVMVSFVTILLCANLIGASKVATVGGFTFGAGIFFFPLSYIFGDILTEVYGYSKARRVVWSGFAALIFAAFMSWVIVNMPPAEGYKNQEALEAIFGATPRIVLASLLAYFAGEFSNSYVLAKLKIYFAGKVLWVRTIGSTLVGELVDSLIFYPVAFGGIWPTEMVITVLFSNYVLKCLWEAMATPVTYRVVNFLKKAENEDFYDHTTNFSPFKL